MRIVFMGTPEFAVPSLQELSKSTHEIAEVVTQPDRPRGRGRKICAPEVKVAAQELGIPVWQPESLRDESALDHLRAMNPDLIVVVAFSILPPEILVIPRFGCINLHASLLPRYRGAAPIQWAIINGESETGVTVFFLEPSVDTGRVIRQTVTPIGPDETYGELYDRLKTLGAKELVAAVDAISSGSVFPVEQNDATATRAPKLSRDDARIDWSARALEIRNLVRGTNPVPGAWTTFRDEPFRIMRVDLVAERECIDHRQSDPGQVVIADPRQGIAVATGDVPVWLTSLCPPARREMSGTAWLNGASVCTGDTFR